MPARKRASTATLPAKPRRTSKKQDIRILALDQMMLAAGLPAATPEYKFAWERIRRKWQIDRAWPDERLKIALEIEGGTHVPGGGAHQRSGKGGRYLSDMTKYNTLALWGWCLIRVTYDMIADGEALKLVQEAFALRERGGAA